MPADGQMEERQRCICVASTRSRAVCCLPQHIQASPDLNPAPSGAHGPQSTSHDSSQPGAFSSLSSDASSRDACQLAERGEHGPHDRHNCQQHGLSPSAGSKTERSGGQDTRGYPPVRESHTILWDIEGYSLGTRSAQHSPLPCDHYHSRTR